tara:strand:- start:8310 stop:8606 length:297 start_codon:yes stop_codon:yes gene_type:complete
MIETDTQNSQDQRVASLISQFYSNGLRDDLRRSLKADLAGLSIELENASKLILVASQRDMLDMVTRIEQRLRDHRQAVEVLGSLGFSRSKDKAISKHR